VIILLPDDEAKLKEQFVSNHERQSEGKLRGQARPNVIFETGIAIGTHHKKPSWCKLAMLNPSPTLAECTFLISRAMQSRGTTLLIGSKTSAAN
jgi:hypothetical protein